MSPISLPALVFAAVDLSLSMAVAVLRFQHNLITGHRLVGPGWVQLARPPEAGGSGEASDAESERADA